MLFSSSYKYRSVESSQKEPECNLDSHPFQIKGKRKRRNRRTAQRDHNGEFKMKNKQWDQAPPFVRGVQQIKNRLAIMQLPQEGTAGDL